MFKVKFLIAFSIDFFNLFGFIFNERSMLLFIDDRFIVWQNRLAAILRSQGMISVSGHKKDLEKQVILRVLMVGGIFGDGAGRRSNYQGSVAAGA